MIVILLRIVTQRVGRPSHGLVVLLHAVFKLSALVLYLFTLQSFITTFILVIILLSADFWVVKNISGRLLAGLRWWSVVDDDGKVMGLRSFFIYIIIYDKVKLILANFEDCAKPEKTG